MGPGGQQSGIGPVEAGISGQSPCFLVNCQLGSDLFSKDSDFRYIPSVFLLTGAGSGIGLAVLSMLMKRNNTKGHYCREWRGQRRPIPRRERILYVESRIIAIH